MSATKDTFDSHFTEKHSGHKVDVIDVFYKRDESEFNKNKDTEPFDTTPIWQRDKQRVRHIRGILFDESGKLPKKPPIKIQPVSTIDNLDRAIEAVATGDADVLKEKKNDAEDGKSVSVLKKRPNPESLESPIPKKVVKEEAEKKSPDVRVSASFNDKEIPVIVLDDDDSDTDKNKSLNVIDLDEVDKSTKTKDVEAATEKSKDPVDVPEALQLNVPGDETMGMFGPFGEPFENKYLCPLCAKFKTKNAEAVKFHLYEELQYPR